MPSIISAKEAYMLLVIVYLIGSYFIYINPVNPRIEKILQLIANVASIIGCFAYVFGGYSFNNAITDTAGLFFIASWVIGYHIKKQRSFY